MFVVKGKAGAPEEGLPASTSPGRWLLGITVAVVALIVLVF